MNSLTKKALEKKCKCGHRIGMHSQVGCWSKEEEEKQLSEQMCKCKKFTPLTERNKNGN